MEDLASAYECSGDKELAIQNFEASLEINQEFENERPLAVLNSMNKMGRTYSRLGENVKSIEWFEKAMEYCKKKFGENNDKIALQWILLGMLFEKSGEFDKAIQYFEKAHQIEVDANNGRHTKQSAETLSQKGRCIAAAGRLEEGLEFCK